jgi:PBP1b-binding outer membrane lipoprotein LpoB
MKKNALKLFLWLALLMVGCMKHKNLEPKQQNEVSLSSKTKNRFYNYKQEALNKATFSRNNVEQTVSRTIALKWDSLEVENLSFLGIEQEVIAIPMRYKNRDLTKNGYRKLIIYKDQAGNDQIKVLEVTAQKEYLQAHNNTMIYTMALKKVLY